MELDILYEDQEVIVALKPAGIATQTKRASEPDMESLLRNHIYKNGKAKGEPYVAVIHRLDQPVEGILVFAKTKEAAKDLNRQLQTEGFGKYYHAMLSDIPECKERELVDYLRKDGRTNTSSVVGKGEPEAKEAILSYCVLKTWEEPKRALVEVRLKTGRHHQIRVQTAHMGCPIVGDGKYGGDQGERLMLSACRLSFTHPKTKKCMSFEKKPSWEA